MADRILGLDIGPSGIKAVQVTVELKGRFRISAVAHYAPGEHESVSDAIRKIRDDDRLKSDYCITSLPVNCLSFRKLQLPFREDRKIRQTLDFELEPLLPYAISDVTADYVRVNSSDPSVEGTEILAAAAAREAVEERVQTLAPLKVPVLEVEAVPMALNLIAAGYDDGCYILLDIGARETVAVFFKGGSIFQIRHFAFGGDTITADLSRIRGIDLEKAEQEKRAGDIGQVWEQIVPVCEKFFAELSFTLQYMHLRREHEKPVKIITTGGGALCGFFNEQLAQYFSIPVETLDIRAMKRVSLPAETAASWNPMIMNNALALALRGTRKADGFNFRSNAATGGIGLIKENAGRFAVALGIVLGILIVNAAAGFFIDQRRLDNLKTETAHILKRSAPGLTKVVDPVQQMRTKVTEARRFAIGAGAGIGTLDVLKKISEAVPESTDFLISDLNYDGEKIEIRGETAGFDSVDKIKRQIAGAGIFKNIVVSGANQVKEKNKVEFELRMNCGR